jgi:hypothetical protein
MYISALAESGIDGILSVIPIGQPDSGLEDAGKPAEGNQMTREQALSIVRDHSEDDAELPEHIEELYIAVFGMRRPEYDDLQTAWSELCAEADPSLVGHW